MWPPLIEVLLNEDYYKPAVGTKQASEGLSTDDGSNIPVARQRVRQHLYARLSPAVLAGALLIRLKPWAELGGSILVGLLVRQALAASLSHGGQILDSLIAGRAQSKPDQLPDTQQRSRDT